MTNRTTEQFLMHAEHVLRKIQMYQRSAETAIPRSQLEYMADQIGKMKEAAAARQLPVKQARHGNLARMIIDGWPLGHSLGKAISELEDEYRRL